MLLLSTIFGAAGDFRTGYRCILDSQIRHLECLKNELSFLDSKVASHAIRSQDAKLLKTLTGIGYYSALLIEEEITDMRSFPSPKRFVSAHPCINQATHCTWVE